MDRAPVGKKRGNPLQHYEKLLIVIVAIDYRCSCNE